MPFKFRGGIQLVYPKPTMNKAIEELDPPSEIILSRLPAVFHARSTQRITEQLSLDFSRVSVYNKRRKNTSTF